MQCSSVSTSVPVGWRNTTVKLPTLSEFNASCCHVIACPPCLINHAAIVAGLLLLKDSKQARKSHFFGGRYENIYLPRESLPGLQVILDTALAHAVNLLRCMPSQLQMGFWFNFMQQGEKTLAHAHDDDDELLSATYYLQVPPQSGTLILNLPDGARHIEPVSGNFVYFHPTVVHEVTEHVAVIPRISLGMNFGPANP